MTKLNMHDNHYEIKTNYDGVNKKKWWGEQTHTGTQNTVLSNNSWP